ncbi:MULTISPECIES: hypothetical protein [unclassified Haloparvum]|uniref:hypothetical protein n=1 Tax=Haloparvum sp. PAK95 TaxID=3418962 RepID=UPI003D2EAE18
MSSNSTDGTDPRFLGGMFDLAELRRRNPVSLGMDVLILISTGFLAILFTKGFWPSVIAAAPVGALLYFGWASSKEFFVSQLLTIGLALLATATYMLPY